MKVLIAFERMAKVAILVCVAMLLGSAVVGYVVPESRPSQTARLKPALDTYRALGLAGAGR